MAATAFACTGRDPVTDMALPGPSGLFVDVDSTRLHYRVMGTSGPKAVVIHGASGSLLDWTAGPAQMLARTNRVLLIDRPGLGFSQRAPADGANPFVQAALMRKAATALGFAEALVIGHSYGGSVALAWALDAPDAVPGLMLLAAPSQVWDGGVGLLYDLTGNPVTGPLLSRLVPAFASDRLVRDALTRIFEPQSPPAGYADAVGARLALRPTTVQANSADLTSLKRHIRKMVPRYPALTMPIELLHGTADDTVPLHIHSDPLSGQLPHARLTRLDGIGHMPHHVATDAMLAALGRLNARA